MRLNAQRQSDWGVFEAVAWDAAGLGVVAGLALAGVGVALALELDRRLGALLAADGLAAPAGLLDLRAAVAHLVAHRPVAQVEWLVVALARQFVVDLLAHVEVRVVDQKISVLLNLLVEFVFLALLACEPHALNLTHHAVDELLFGVADDVCFPTLQVQFEAMSLVELAQRDDATFLHGGSIVKCSLVDILDNV